MPETQQTKEPEPEPECDHEWEVHDDSFSHEYGIEIIVYEQCKLCQQTREHDPEHFNDYQ